MRHLLPAAAIVMAELRSAELAITADRVLIAEDWLSEDQYIAALAVSVGARTGTLSDVPRQACPMDDALLLEAANVGHLGYLRDGEFQMAIAPRLVDSRKLVNALAHDPSLARRVLLVSAERLRAYVAGLTRAEIEHRTVKALHTVRPELSAAQRSARRINAHSLFASVGVTALVGIAAPALALHGIEIALGAVFLAWTLLRVLSICRRGPKPDGMFRRSHDRLPVYTVIVALYRETASVPGLIAALRRLNYPAEQLDIKLVLEPDDHATRRAIERLRLGPPFTIIIAPDVGPRTKPKALNAALPFARGPVRCNLRCRGSAGAGPVVAGARRLRSGGRTAGLRPGQPDHRQPKR